MALDLGEPLPIGIRSASQRLDWNSALVSEERFQPRGIAFARILKAASKPPPELEVYAPYIMPR